MQRLNGSKEFKSIIENYKYEAEVKQRLLKQGKSFEQGLRDMLHQRNLDIKKHEMEEDEAEKFQSHLGGLHASSKNRLKIAMKSMEDDQKKEDRRNVISVLIKNKDDDIEKEKISEITDFASEDAGEAALNKKIQGKTGGLLRKPSLSRNPMLPNTLFNGARRNSKSGSVDFEGKMDLEFKQNSKKKKKSSKKILSGFADGSGVIVGQHKSSGSNVNFSSPANINQMQKKSGNMFASTSVNKFPTIEKHGSVKQHKKSESQNYSTLYNEKYGVSMEIIKSSLTSPSILKHFGKSTRQQYMSNLENIINNPEAAKLVAAIEKQSRIFKFFRNLDNYEKKLVGSKEHTNKIFIDHEKSSEQLKKKFKYVWKNKFI